MRAIRIHRLAEGLDRLAPESLPDPDPRTGEVQIAIEAAGVNFPDLLMCAGRYQYRPELPFTPGMEWAGRISKIGPGVNNLKEGMAVMGAGRQGAFAEKICLAATDLFPKPAALSMAEAACFSTGALTARVALFRRAKLHKGERLLVLGAAGGMGLAAVALGVMMGAEVIALASSEEKRALARAQGAAHALAPEPGWREAVLSLTQGRGVDVVYDPVGGDFFAEAVRAVAWDGRYLVIGFAGGSIPSLPINYPLIKGFSLVGVRAGESSRRNPQQGAEDRAFIYACAEAGQLKPPVGASFPLAQTGQALQQMQARRAIGKLAILPQR